MSYNPYFSYYPSTIYGQQPINYSSINPSNTHFVLPTVAGASLEILNTRHDRLSKQDKAILQQIKHANDPKLNNSWGPNPYWGPQDTTVEALEQLARITANTRNR